MKTVEQHENELLALSLKRALENKAELDRLVAEGKARICDNHFAMRTMQCMKGCGDLCIAAEPERVNASLRQALSRNEGIVFREMVKLHTAAETKIQLENKELRKIIKFGHEMLNMHDGHGTPSVDRAKAYLFDGMVKALK